MRKVFAGFLIAILFFVVGRNQPPVTEAISHNKFTASSPNKDTSSPAQQHADKQPPTQFAVDEISPLPVPPLAQRLASQLDSELFETLYSNDFKTQWINELPVLKQRLFSALPQASTEQDDFEKEVTARLGILKALGSLTQQDGAENNKALKNLLLSYIEHEAKQTNTQWVLQREAMHSLTSNSDLTELELQIAANNLDLRARNTASLPDRQIIDRALEVEQ